MKRIILYGAGKKGINYAKMLYEHGIEIEGFCDTYKTGNVIFECEGGVKKQKSIFCLRDIDCKRYSIIIALSNRDDFEEISSKIREYKIDVITIEQAIYRGKNSIEANREYVAEYHIDNMENYFDLAEREDSLDIFWSENSFFYRMFQELDLTRVVELACGRGRHVRNYISYAKDIVLVDILEKNIDYCKSRFRNEKEIQYYVNNGYDLCQLDTDSCTALFTYDAMVHFEMLDIFQYLKETKRILVRGGKALFHHSNNTEDYKITFSTGKYGRNYMSKELFAYLANRAGLTVIEQQKIDWADEKELDCITLIGNF